MPNHPALEYAEVTLGVHQVYEEGRAALEALEQALNNLDSAQDSRRILDDRLDDREMELVIEHRGTHGELSEAAFTRHMKEAKFRDEALQTLRRERAVAAGVVSGSEIDVDFYRMKVKFTSARMEQLGGYLHYLGAVKNAEAARPLIPVAAASSE